MGQSEMLLHFAPHFITYLEEMQQEYLCRFVNQNDTVIHHGFPVASINRRIKSGKDEEEASRKKQDRFKTVFSQIKKWL